MPLDNIPSGLRTPEIIVNGNFVSLNPFSVGGPQASAIAGLTLALYGGLVNNAGTLVTVAPYVVTLGASATTYVEMTNAGVFSTNTSAFTAGRQAAGIATSGASTFTYVDKRTPGFGTTGAAAGATPTGTGFTHITSGAQDGAAVAVDLSGAHATGILAAARMVALTGDVTNSAGAVATTIKNSVSLVTPVLNVATATSINKIALTAPATSATLTIADGKTLTASNSITLAGTDSTTMTFPPATASIGYLGIPQNSQSAAYTTVLADNGKHIYHPSADTTARTWTIDSNANVAYPIGAALTFVNDNAAGVITIAITSDTMRLAGTGTTGSRTLAANGNATAIKMTSTSWQISGTGLT